jgi:L-ascorbate metabolism protein UlaG (beta-lactamase superfamily)
MPWAIRNPADCHPMQRSLPGQEAVRGSYRPRHRLIPYVLVVLAMLLALLASSRPTLGAESLCEAGLVHWRHSVPHIMPVSTRVADASSRVVTIQWLGHSSFLIVSPGGTTALTDPHPWHSPAVVPDVVTISNEHPTHNQARAMPGNPRVLRGRTPEGEWLAVNVTIGELAIKSLPSSGGNAYEVPAQNTIFVFRAEGLCIVHLGNLRQPLNEEQRLRLGRPDVLMVPIDGQWTLAYDQVALTISQLQPAIVLPMHYDVSEHVRFFMQFIKATAPVRTLTESTLKLRRDALPGATEVIILGYRDSDG